LAALATDLIASSISRPSASKLSMMDIVDREADAERSLLEAAGSAGGDGRAGTCKGQKKN